MSAWTNFRDSVVDGISDVLGIHGEEVLNVSHSISPTVKLGEEDKAVASPMLLFSIIKNIQTEKTITSQVRDDIIGGHTGSLRRMYRKSNDFQFKNKAFQLTQQSNTIIYNDNSPLLDYLLSTGFLDANNVLPKEIIFEVVFENAWTDNAVYNTRVMEYEGLVGGDAYPLGYFFVLFYTLVADVKTEYVLKFLIEPTDVTNPLSVWYEEAGASMISYVLNRNTEVMTHNIGSATPPIPVTIALKDVNEETKINTYPLLPFKVNGKFIESAPKDTIEGDLYNRAKHVVNPLSGPYRHIVESLSKEEYEEKQPTRNDNPNISDEDFAQLEKDWQENKSNFEDSLEQTYHSYIGRMIPVERDTKSGAIATYKTLEVLHAKYSNFTTQTTTTLADGTIEYGTELSQGGEAAVEDDFGFSSRYNNATQYFDPSSITDTADTKPLILAQITTMQQVVASNDTGADNFTLFNDAMKDLSTIEDNPNAEVLEYISSYGIGFTHYEYDRPLVYKEVVRTASDPHGTFEDITLKPNRYAVYLSRYDRSFDEEVFIRFDDDDIFAGTWQERYYAWDDSTDPHLGGEVYAGAGTPVRLNIAIGTDTGYKVFRIHILTNSHGVSFENKYKVSVHSWKDRITTAGGVAKNKGELTLPLLYEVVDSLGFSNKYRLYKETEVLVFLYAIETYIPWYKTKKFATIIQVVMIIIALVSLFFDYSGFTAGFFLALAEYVVLSIVIQWAMKLVLEQLEGKGKLVQILAIVLIIVLVIYFGNDASASFEALSTSEILLQAIQVINQFSSMYTQVSLMDEVAEAKKNKAKHAKYQQEIDDLQKAYIDADEEVSLLVNTMIQYRHIETAEEMLDRTLNIDTLEQSYAIILPSIDVTDLIKL